MKKKSIFVISFLVMYSFIFFTCSLPIISNKTPQKPKNVVVKLQGDSTLKVTWDAPNSKNSFTYIVELINVTDPSDVIKKDNISNTEFIFTVTDGLKEGITYIVKVYTKNNGKTSSATKIEKPYLYSLEEALSPSTPRNPEMVQKKDKIKVTWDAPNNLGKNVDGSIPIPDSITYTVELINANNPDDVITKEGIYEKTFEFSGSDYKLMTNTPYIAKIYARNQVKKSTASQPTNEIVYRHSKPPGIPTNLRVTKGINGLNITWTEPADWGIDSDGKTTTSISYTIKLYKDNHAAVVIGESDSIPASTPSNTKSYFFSNNNNIFQSGTTYYIRIYASSDEREGLNSTPVPITY